MPTAILRAYKFRLEPSQAQAQKLCAFAGMCRFVSNWMWQQRQDYYAACGKSIGYNAQAAQLKPLKLQYPWLKKAPSQILQQALRNLDQAYQRFFKGEASYPKPRKRGKHDSFRFPQGFALCGNYVRLPKLGHIKFRLSRTVKGVIKNVTVSRKGRHWYVSFQVEQANEFAPTLGPAIGIDRGVTDLIACSNGKRVPAIDFSEPIRKKKHLQRQLARRKKGGSNWRKTLSKLQRIEERIANIRKDTLHKLTTAISKNHAVVVVEKLRVKDMSKSAKGTLEEPGKNVRAKSGLNRSILQQGWGEMVRQLKYKLSWRGGSLIEVSPAFTSQKCSCCGHTEKANRRGKLFSCCRCSHTEDADINAAKNILAAGHVVSVCGDIGLVGA